MKISVIIPTYKPQRYIVECLDSLRRQSLEAVDYEVIIVLNGCREPYSTMINQWITSHRLNNFSLIQTDICGVSNARNIGLDEARGEYVTFIDDDDFVSSSYLEELYSKASPEIISLCYPLSFVDGSKKYLPYYITKDYYKYFNDSPVVFAKPRRFFAGPVYKLIHKSIIGNRRFDVRFKNGEDSLFMFLISDKMRLVDFTSTFDVAVIIEADCEEGIFLPTKVGDYMQIHLPIFAVSPKNGELNDLRNEHYVSYFADVKSSEAVCDQLLLIYRDFLSGCLKRTTKVKPEYLPESIVEQYINI